MLVIVMTASGDNTTNNHQTMLIVMIQLYVPQRGVQWKQGVVMYTMLYTSLIYNTTPIHCTPLPLHPSVMNTQQLIIIKQR